MKTELADALLRGLMTAADRRVPDMSESDKEDLLVRMIESAARGRNIFIEEPRAAAMALKLLAQTEREIT